MAAALRSIRHRYVRDGVLPAEHLEDWIRYTGEVFDWFGVEHDPASGSHRTIKVPIAAAVVGYAASAAGLPTFSITTSRGFEWINVVGSPSTTVRQAIRFTLPAGSQDWFGRFGAEWDFTTYTDPPVTVDPPVRPTGERSGFVLLGNLVPSSGAAVNYNAGGVLVIFGRKAA